MDNPTLERRLKAKDKLLRAQAQDLSRQLQEAWHDLADMTEARDVAREISVELAEQKHYITDQLHRVARERDQERELRLAEVEFLEEQLNVERDRRIDAEDAMFNSYLRKHEQDADLEIAAGQLRDTYLNEEE